MSAATTRWSSAGTWAAVLSCLLAFLVAGSGVCQPGETKVTIVTTGPLMYTGSQQGALVQDESALPGARIGLEPVDSGLEPGAPSVAYDVTLLDLAKPKGALDAVQEGAPIILTPERLAELRRRHAPALSGGFQEQAWSDLVADIAGQSPSARPKSQQPAPGGRNKGGKPGDGLPEIGWPGHGDATLLELPQRRLLWELLRQASAPQLFLDFDAVNRPRTWGGLSGKPAVTATGAQPSDLNLLSASAGIQGLVLVRNEDGRLTPPDTAVEVVITGTPGGQRKTWTVATNSVGYFYWPLPEDTGSPGKYNVGVPGTDQIAEVGAAPGSWSNVVIISSGPLSEGLPGNKGLTAGGTGARDAVGIVGALTGLLAGTAAGSIVPALSSSGLPLQTGVAWTKHSSARAYFGVERALAPSFYDRALRSLGPANLVIEFWKYPLVSQQGRAHPGEVEATYRERAKALSDAAARRYEEAKDAAAASIAELDRLAKIIKAAHPETDAVAYKALVESQIALRKDCRDRRSEVEALEAAYRAQLDLYDLCSARELQAVGPTGASAGEIWATLRASYNRYGQLPEKPSIDDVNVLYARIEQRFGDDSARAAKLGPDGQFEDPRGEHLAYEGTPQRQESLGYVRFLRVRLIATGIPTDELNIASRLRPGRWGVSAGMVTGGKGNQPAVGGWWLWEHLGLRLTVGSTLSGSGQPGRLMVGCGVQVPLGSTSSGSSSSAAASKAPSAASAPAATATKPAGASAATSSSGTSTNQTKSGATKSSGQ